MRQRYCEGTGHLLAMSINYFLDHLVKKKVNRSHGKYKYKVYFRKWFVRSCFNLLNAEVT